MAYEAGRVVAELEARNGQFDNSMRASAQVVEQSMSRVERSALNAERSVARSSQGIVRSSGQVQQATRNLGFQISDVGAQLSGGQSPFVIFGQQAPQFAQAFNDISASGANLGTVLRSIALPGILAVISVLATLIEKGYGAAKANDAHRASTDALRSAVDRLADAAAKNNRQTEVGIQLDLRKAEAQRQVTIQTRQRIEAELRKQKAELGGAQATENNAPGGFAIPGRGAASRQANVSDLNRQLRDNAKAIKEVDTAIATGKSQLILRGIAAQTDATAAATQKYDDTIVRLQRRFQSGRIDAGSFERLALAATRQRDAALEAAQKSRGSSNSIIADQARLEAATNGVQRAEAQLVITRKQALADQRAGKISADEAQSRITAATSAVYAARQASKDNAKAIREEAESARELAAAYEDVVKRLDPERAARTDFSRTIDQIEKLRQAGKLTVGDAAIYAGTAADKERERRTKAEGERFKAVFGDGDPLGDFVKQADRERDARFDAAAEADNLAQDVRENNIRSLANLYEDVFTRSSGQVWDNFKREGLRALAVVLAQATITSFSSGGGGFGSLLKNIGTAASAALGKGGVPRMATGGSMLIGGRGGTDQNLLSLNGQPIAAVSKGETLNIAPNTRAAAQRGGGTTIVQQSFNLDARYGITTSELLQYVNDTARSEGRRGGAAAVVANARSTPGTLAQYDKLEG